MTVHQELELPVLDTREYDVPDVWLAVMSLYDMSVELFVLCRKHDGY